MTVSQSFHYRRILPGLFAGLAWVLAGCSASEENTRTTIRLQAVADPVEAQAYRALIAAFEKTNPDIQVSPRFVGGQREHVAHLSTALAGGNAPELFLINYRRYGQFLGKSLMRPLGPLLTASHRFDADAFYAPALEAFQVNGEQLCLPQNISTQVVYYNRRLFQAAGLSEPADDWRWKDFHDAARALTQDRNRDGRFDIYGLDFDPDLVHMVPFVWQAGGDIVDSLQAPTTLTLGSTDSVIGLMFPKRLRTEVAVFPSLAERRAVGPEQRFLNGELGMVIQSRRFTTTLRAATGLDWDVAPLPRQKQAATLLHADAYCLSRAIPEDKSAAAGRFVAFALSPEGQSLLARTGRIVPSRRSVAESPAFLDPQQPPRRARVFLDNIEIVRRLPVSPTWYEVELRAKPIIEEWMFEDTARLTAESATGLNDGYRLVKLLNDAVGDRIRPPPSTEAP